MELVPNPFSELSKLTENCNWPKTDENKPHFRIEAGNSNLPDDNSIENLKSNTDLHEQPKCKRKKRLKPLPKEFASLVDEKDDKYGIGASYAAKTARKTDANKNGRTLQERLQKKGPDSKLERSPGPSSTVKAKRIKQQVFVANIRKLPEVPENEQQKKKIIIKKGPRAKSLNSSRPKYVNTKIIKSNSFNDNNVGEKSNVTQTQRTGRKLRATYPTKSEKRWKSVHSVAFNIADKKSDVMLNSKDNISQSYDSMKPGFSEITVPRSRSESPQSSKNEMNSDLTDRNIEVNSNSKTSLIFAKKSRSNTSGSQRQYVKRSRSASLTQVDEKLPIFTNQDAEIKRSSKTSLISAKKSRSNISNAINLHGKHSRSASSVHKENLEDSLSTTSTQQLRSPATSTSKQSLRNTGSTSSLKKRYSLKKKIKPTHILLSMFRQSDKNTEDKPLKKTQLKTEESTLEKIEKENKSDLVEKEETPAQVLKEGEAAATSRKRNFFKRTSKETIKSFPSGASTSGKNTNTDSKNILKTSSPTRSAENSSEKSVRHKKGVHYKNEISTLDKKDFFTFAKEFFEQNIWNRTCTKKNNCLPVSPPTIPPRAHGYMKNFLNPVSRGKHKQREKNPKEKTPKENKPYPLTDQVRAHAFRKDFFKVVAYWSKKEKSLQKQLNQIAPLPFPRVHGFTPAVLAQFKCGRLKEKEEEIAKETKKIKKKSKKKITLQASTSQVTTVKSLEVVKAADIVEKDVTSGETTVVTKSKTVKTKKSAEDDSDGDVEVKKSVTKTITTTVKRVEKVVPDCPYVLGSDDDSKKCAKRCCCQFLKSLPPTPRETFRKNPGNPHYYPAPGHRRAWKYEVKLKQLHRLEQERQRLCAEQRGIPYNGPPRQYQDFFEDTTLEDRCCCDSCKTIKSTRPDPTGFECNKGDPHQYPTVAGFRHYFDKREELKAADTVLAELKKECEETFPEIKPLVQTKPKINQCRGAILNTQEDKEERIQEIVERMAAICSCLDDCDCKAALQMKEPYINLDENREVCCCSKKEPMTETFDCNAGDPHRQPTIAAFKQLFVFKKKKKELLQKRKSIFDEIVQHGTEPEIQVARISLMKQMLEDGTKEEKEEARLSLEQEEVQVTIETKETRIEPDICDCPQIQEIVIMIEDSVCDEQEIYMPCKIQEISEFGTPSAAGREYSMQTMPEYPGYFEDWGREQFMQLPENMQEFGATEFPMDQTNSALLSEAEPLDQMATETLQTITPSGGNILTHDPQSNLQTRTPTTSLTQIGNTLETQEKKKRNSVGLRASINYFFGKRNSKSTLSQSEKSEVSQASTTSIFRKKESKLHLSLEHPDRKQVESTEDGSEGSGKTSKKSTIMGKKKSKSDSKSTLSLENTMNMEFETSEGSTKSSKNIMRDKKELTSNEKSDILTNALPSDIDQESAQEQGDGKKRKSKAAHKEKNDKCKKTSKEENNCSKDLQPPKHKIKPKCVCFSDLKNTMKKDKDACIQVQIPKRIKMTEKTKHKKIKEHEKENVKPSQENYACKCSSEVMQIQICSDIVEVSQDKNSCKDKSIRKSRNLCTAPKTEKKSKCKGTQYQARYNTVPECMHKPRSNSLTERSKKKTRSVRLSANLSNDVQTCYSDTNLTVNWCKGEDIYYPPPEPLEKFYQPTNFDCYPTCLGNTEMFNFPQPKCSPIYQEYPQYNISPDNEVILSLQIENDQPSFACTPQEFKTVCFIPPEEEKDEISEVEETVSSSSLSSDDKSQKDKCKEQITKVPCRCHEQMARIPCMCNNRYESESYRYRGSYERNDYYRREEQFPQKAYDDDPRDRKKEIKREPVEPILVERKDVKKSKWPYWKCVTCKDGKVRFLKTSKCPIPRRGYATQKNPNCHCRSMNDEFVPFENNFDYEAMKKAATEKPKSLSEKREPYTKRGSIQRETRVPKETKKPKSKYSDKSERKKRDSMMYEGPHTSTAPVLCCCQNRPDVNAYKYRNDMSCTRRVSSRSKSRAREKSVSKKVEVSSESEEECNEETGEYMLLVQTGDGDPCDFGQTRIITITEPQANENPAIELLPIDPFAPLPPCLCQGSKQQGEPTDKRDSQITRKSVGQVKRNSRPSIETNEKSSKSSGTKDNRDRQREKERRSQSK